jgi:ubiquinone/menaquinone biosynthesis C-methylase UbiE
MQGVAHHAIKTISVQCCVCDTAHAEKIGSGYDFEYFSCPDIFDVYQCKECGNVYLNPRPDVSEFNTIYPANYHSLDFSEANYSFVHNIRSRLEANRLLRYCTGIPDKAKILDVGCGDGFHLKLLKKYGNPNWTLEGVDLDSRAVAIASKGALMIHQGSVEELDLGSEQYDLVYAIQTIEHVAHPDKVLAAIFHILKPGGRLVLVTDNTDSVDFTYFKKSYWGGYHFPRHWNLFNPKSMTRLAHKTGFEVSHLQTIVSPVNWVYSIHNLLVDKKAPQWLINRFTLKSPISLGVFTLLDMILQKFGRGALLNGYLIKPVHTN